MASIRKFKKEISYLTGEIISNCELAAYFQGDKAAEGLSKVVTAAIENHNGFREAAINVPKENRKQHFAKIKKEMEEKSEKLFSQISEICKNK